MPQAIPAYPISRCISIEAASPVVARIVTALETVDAPPDAISVFETGHGRSEITAHYLAEPDISKLERPIKDAAGERIGPLRVERIEADDWIARSELARPPVRAGRFLIHGRHDRARIPPHSLAIEIDAGLAFGTAHHASTRGCLLALDSVLKQQRPKCVLDLGTGSGILAIATAKALGVTILASDNDPVALAVAKDNANKNCASPHLRFVEASGFAHPALRGVRADLVFANLLQRALLDLAPQFRRHLKPCGLAVLSGITQEQSARVEARFRSLGFIMKSRIILDGWTTLVLVHRKSRPGHERD